MKCRHQQINILEREVKIPADKRIGTHPVVNVNSLPYTMICFQEMVYASFCPDIQDDGYKNVV